MADAPRDARLEQLERRVQNDPMSVAFAALAEEYRRAGRLEDAIATCRSGLTRHPAYLSARVTLGRALAETGALDEAEAELKRVVAAAPENLAAVRCLADLHRRRRDSHDRGEDLESAPAEPTPVPEPPAVAAPVAPRVEPGPTHGETVTDAPVMAQVAAGPPADDTVIAGLETFLWQIVTAREARDEARTAR